MRQQLRNNSLSIVLLTVFLILFLGQSIAGFLNYNQDQLEHHEARLSYVDYLRSPAFLEATMENWESEFLQMCAYVVLTVFLVQKGSAESKAPDEINAVNREPSTDPSPDAPWPVRKGGIALKIYENSLAIAFIVLFLMSFFMHAVGGAGVYSEKELVHGQSPVTALQYLGTARFWFESLQNWQSEFLAIASMVILTIFLRQRGSPESKAVDSPHSKTGK